jgi:hypothetical protein
MRPEALSNGRMSWSAQWMIFIVNQTPTARNCTDPTRGKARRESLSALTMRRGNLRGRRNKKQQRQQQHPKRLRRRREQVEDDDPYSSSIMNENDSSTSYPSSSQSPETSNPDAMDETAAVDEMDID